MSLREPCATQAREMKMMVEAVGTDVMGVCLDSGNPVWMLEDPHMTLETGSSVDSWRSRRRGHPSWQRRGKTAGQQRIEDLAVCVKYTRELLRRLQG